MVRQHRDEGRQMHLYESPRWYADLDLSREILILRDAQNDGIFEDVETLSPGDWENAGYSQGVWNSTCP